MKFCIISQGLDHVWIVILLLVAAFFFFFVIIIITWHDDTFVTHVIVIVTMGSGFGDGKGGNGFMGPRI